MTEANITWLTENIATGGDFSFDRAKQQRQFLELLGMDINLVIDCRMEAADFAQWSYAPEVKYVYLPTNDAYGHVIPPAHFDAAVAEARAIIEAGGKVFAHCHMGINRGPSTAMAILMDQGMSAIEAFTLIHEKRPIAAINYAEDALRAHLLRNGAVEKEIALAVKNFQREANLVYNDEARKNSQRALRAHHERDRAELNR